jgi:hypothetical protein
MDLFLQSLTPSDSILVVGASQAEQNQLAHAGHEPTCFDYSRDGMRWEYLPRLENHYHALYCAHTLEHVRNVGVMLDAMYAELRPGGLLCIVVPPAKHNIVGGHLTLWNAGLLLYNLIRAHFDCAKAAVRTYDYNVAVLVRKVHADYPEDVLHEDNGDLEILAPYFPVPMPQDQDGQIAEHAWTPR